VLASDGIAIFLMASLLALLNEDSADQSMAIILPFIK
jgi:hypothetical protein